MLVFRLSAHNMTYCLIILIVRQATQQIERAHRIRARIECNRIQIGIAKMQSCPNWPTLNELITFSRIHFWPEMARLGSGRLHKIVANTRLRKLLSEFQVKPVRSVPS